MLYKKQNTSSSRLHEKNEQNMGQTGNESSSVVNFTSQRHQEREEVMSYISDALLNETPLQSYTVSIGDNPNVEVEDNEINIKTAHHEVRQEEELGVENKVAH